MPDWEM